MKEKIYTIPVNDAFDLDCECPICELERKTENDTLEFLLGPSMMEDDMRVKTNEEGFCNRHFKKMYDKQNRLSLALILETHIERSLEKLKKSNPGKSINKNKKKSLKFSDVSKSIASSYILCTRLEFFMDKYIYVIFHLLKNDSAFKKKFKEKKGFCLNHTTLLLNESQKYLPQKEYEDFVKIVYNMQIENFERLKEEVNWFTKKFDYRFKDEPWKNSKDSIKRSIEKLSGYMDIKDDK